MRSYAFLDGTWLTEAADPIHGDTDLTEASAGSDTRSSDVSDPWIAFDLATFLQSDTFAFEDGAGPSAEDEDTDDKDESDKEEGDTDDGAGLLGLPFFALPDDGDGFDGSPVEAHGWRDFLRRWLGTPEPEPEPEPQPEPEPEPAPMPDMGYKPSDFTGDGYAVVVIDDGYSLDYDQSAFTYGYDFSGRNDSSALVDLYDSHGSQVAQVITNTASGADIIHLKVFKDGSSSASIRDIDQALDWVIANGADYNVAAVNVSLGYGNATSEQFSSLSREFAELDDLGILSIVAAGNSGATYDDGVNAIAANPHVIGVSSVDEDGAFSAFSQKSETLTDIAALGEGIVIEDVYGGSFQVAGTSFSTPYISGLAALLQDAAETTIGRKLTDDEFLEILQASGEDIAGAESLPDYDPSVDPEGYKIADADAALDWFLDNLDAYSSGDTFAFA